MCPPFCFIIFIFFGYDGQNFAARNDESLIFIIPTHISIMDENYDEHELIQQLMTYVDILIFYPCIQYEQMTTLAATYYAAKEYFSMSDHNKNNLRHYTTVHDQRPKWNEIMNRLSDKMFRRMFRMEKAVFREFGETIMKQIGDARFKPEGENNIDEDIDESKMTNTRKLAGEIKLALAI